VRKRPRQAAGLAAATWEAIGPRTSAAAWRPLAFDPRNARRSSPNGLGGLWISNDGGASWEANFDFLPNLSITTIAIDPAAPTRCISARRGERRPRGAGRFKSTDGGRTWTLLAATNVDANPDAVREPARRHPVEARSCSRA